MLKLGVNIDHVATLRQARYATMLKSNNAEPDIVTSALAARDGGANSITMHVRGDRRHVQEEDVVRVKESCDLPINFEMASTAEMIAMAGGLEGCSNMTNTQFAAIKRSMRVSKRRACVIEIARRRMGFVR